MRNWKVILSLVAIFAAGAVTGAVIAVRVVATVANNRLNPERWPAAIVAEYRSRLKLTPEQVEKIKPAAEEGRQELRRVMGTCLHDYIGILRRFDEQLVPVLTGDQRRLHEQMREELRTKFRQRTGLKLPEA